MGMSGVLAPVLLTVASLSPGRAAIVVAYESGVDAYGEALAGLGEALGPTVRLVDLAAPGSDLTRAWSGPDVQLVIAMGSRALSEVRAHRSPLPVIATMVLPAGVPLVGESEPPAVIGLDIPLSVQLQALHSLWPNHYRVGIVRNPARSRYSAEVLEARARKEGYTVVVVDCDGPARLIKVVSSMKGKVDFVLCFPDPDLYNPVTIKPLVMVSLEQRLPLIGFSPAFVRAGAAAGIYPDYREVGRQTGEMAQRVLRGADRSSEEAPRKIRLALNQRVVHLLGMEFHSEGLPVEVFR